MEFEEDVNLTKLLEKYPNKFILSIAVSKRARQIQEGAKPLIEITENDLMTPVKIALKEIAAGVVEINTEIEEDEDTELLDKMDVQLEAELDIDEEAKSKDLAKETKSSEE